MSYKESDIMHEAGDYFVLREAPKGRTLQYNVYQNVGTHSVRRSLIALGEAGLPRAIADCDRRAAL